jgi:alkylation response protein AidB-like acyl-CoA dehydrogenase
MDFRDPEHVVMLRETIRRFLARETTPEMIASWDRDDHIPREMHRKIGDLGVCGLTVEEAYGGAGRDVIAMVAVIEELARASMSLAGMYISTACYGGMNISVSGTPEQKAQFLPDIAAGRTLFAYGLSEPDVGGDLASVTTRAERHGDKVVINGAKRWCSGADTSDYIFVLLRSDATAPRYKNLSFVLVPPTAPGVTLTHTRTMGANGVSTCDVNFDNVEVPFGAVLGGEAGWNNGWSQLAGPALEAEKLEVPALALGVAEAAVAEAWTYAEERRQFGQRISGFQSIRHKLADAKTKLQACRLMLYWAAWLVETGAPSSAETSMAKLYVTDTCRDVVLNCQQVLGAYGYAEGFAMERYVRDIIVTPIFGGSSAIQLNNIANRMKLAKG